LRAFVAGRDADKAAVALVPANPADADNVKLDVTEIGFAANAMLIAREYEAALAALDEAQPAAPDQNWLDLVRAGALMFLNREDEAKATIMKHRGEKTYSGKIWEAETIDAMARLRAKGLTHPLMDEIIAAFSPAQ
jgi:predicted Zn-dependent protease